MAKYGVGIIGTGWVAGEYVKVFRDHPLTEIVGVYNRTSGKGAALLADHGVEAREYGSVDELFDDERIGIIASCTHPDSRREHCVRAAETGRHIVVEKPVGLSLDDSLAIRDAVAKAGVKTVTSFVLRWNPQFLTVQQLIADGVLGDLIYGEADYWHPFKTAYPGYASFVKKEVSGSAVVCGGCHAVDILRFLGGEIVEVAAYSGPKRINHGLRVRPEHRRVPQVRERRPRQALDRPRRRYAVHLQLQAHGDRGHDHQQRGVLLEALPRQPRLLEVPHDRAGLGRGRPPPVQGGDRRTSWSASRTTSSRTPRSTTPGSRWRCASRWTSRPRREASRSRCRSRQLVGA